MADRDNRGRFISGLKGSMSSHWKGGRITIGDNYIGIYSPNHPYASKTGYVLEHRLVMEAHLGRTLLPTEVVHHINGDRKNNRIENLMLFDSSASHIRFHLTGQKWSEDRRRRHSQLSMGKKGTRNGVKLSEETKHKISLARINYLRRAKGGKNGK